MEKLTTIQFNTFNFSIYGTYENPLFKLKDFFIFLKPVDENIFVEKFQNDKELIFRINEKNLFFTEKGLHKFLIFFNQKLSEEFQNWIYQIFNELKIKTIENIQKIENKKRIQMKENFLIEQFNEEPGLYIFGPLKENENIFKYGETTQLEKRIKTHKKNLNPESNLLEFIPTPYHKELEKKFQNYIQGNRIKFKNQTEIVKGIDQKKLFEIATNIKMEIHKIHLHGRYKISNEKEHLKLKDKILKFIKWK